jgi:hypothetical protein
VKDNAGILSVVRKLLVLVRLADSPEKDKKEQKEEADVRHVKYGSVGSDNLKGGLPYAFLKVFPTVFEHLLPHNDIEEYKGGYKGMGFIYERDDPGRPIGFSKRRIGFKYSGMGLDMVGLNCGLCHVSAIQNSKEGFKVIAGMPGHTADAEAFFVFLFKAANHQDFKASVLLDAIEKDRNEPLRWISWLGYSVLTPILRWEIKKLEKKFCFIHGVNRGVNHGVNQKICPRNLEHEPTKAGPGRIDTWGPYKVLRLQTWPWFYEPPYTWIDLDKISKFFDSVADIKPKFLEEPHGPNAPVAGFADAPSIWNLEARMGRGFHWDGNTVVLNDSGIIAAIGVGTTPATLDHEGVTRIVRWARSASPPKWDDLAPGEQDKKVKDDKEVKKLKAGEQLYRQHCASCHSPGGERFGLQEPIRSIGTDRHRLDAFTIALSGKLDNRVGVGYEWKPRFFRKTFGYSNVPLDGIWLRAPYLHNGSVPTLRDLLKRPDERPKQFCRGNTEYDWDDVGFASKVVKENGDEPCGRWFLYDTTKKGNGNGGHLFGTDLKRDEKTALLEYLKIL